MDSLLIIGAGGHGKSIAEAVLLANSYRIAGFLDDDYNAKKNVWDYPVLGQTHDLEKYRSKAQAAIVAIGNNSVRERIFNLANQAGFFMPTVIHPAAYVSPRATIGDGSCIMASAVVGTEAVLGVACIVNVNVSVDHHCILEDYAHLGVGVQLAGGVKVGQSAWMQAGSSVGYRVKVPAGANILPGTGLV